MADTSNLTRFLSDVADAIREKKNTDENILAANFDQEILDIKSGQSVSDGVDFIDYDGTLLYSYTLEEIQAMTELPPLPTQEGLICQEWNWSLEDIKEHNRRLIVGATYITDDGKTRVYVDLTVEGKLDMSLYFSQTIKNGVEVDWGDGSPVETFDEYGGSNYINPIHTYASIGKYIITLNSIDGCELRLGALNYNNNIVGSYSKGTKYNKYYYESSVTRVNIGKNVSMSNGFQFENCYSLIEVTIPKGITTIGSRYF